LGTSKIGHDLIDKKAKVARFTKKNCVVGGNRVDEMNDFSALGPIPQNLALGLKRRAMDFPYPSA
jgi:hypothetical protein